MKFVLIGQAYRILLMKTVATWPCDAPAYSYAYDRGGVGDSYELQMKGEGGLSLKIA